MDAYMSFIGWAFLPNLAANVIQSIWYSIKYQVDSNAKPAPNSLKYRKHRNRIYCFVVLAYLAYTIAEVDRATPANYYDILDLNIHTFTQKSLKTNFRKASLLYHPDKVGAQGAEMFVAIRQAHDVLADPISRLAYNKFGPSTIVSCVGCKTIKDHISRGLPTLVTFYAGTGTVLFLMSLLGKGQFGRYWRFVVLFGMGALELAMVLRPEPLVLLSWIMPHRITFEQTAILHQVFVSTFIAISQIGPILAPEKEQSDIKQLLQRLEMLTSIANVESAASIQGAFDAFRDEESMAHMKRVMGKMALDVRLAQDTLFNGAQSAIHRRLLQKKGA